MDPRDEGFRSTVINCLTRANIDTRDLTVEIGSGVVSITGYVPSREQQQRLDEVLTDQVQDLSSIECDVQVRPAAPGDNVDGKGRSPFTGTAAGSAPGSRHQLDRT